MAKEFKTIAELISLLESRGVITDCETFSAINRESYYAIINGYKSPFLDRDSMMSSSEDVYKKGTEFRWIYDLFLFDRDLRAITFKYLMKVEAAMKSAVVYSFCHNHQKHKDYLDISYFCSSDDYLVSRHYKRNKQVDYSQNLSRLMALLNKKTVKNKHSRPFTKHYIEKYGFVPLWVLSNELTFGNIVNFYQLMQPKDREEVCRILAREANREESKTNFLSQRKLLRYAKVLVGFRNICAHDERLYCAKINNDGFNVIADGILNILGLKVLNCFLDEVSDLFGKYKGRLKVVSLSSLLKDMGFNARG